MMYVWHMAKSVVKLLAQKDKLKDCEQLLPWIQFISNHLWCRVVQTCNRDTQLLTEKWKSIVYYVNNVHEWNGGKDSKFNKCGHLTLPIEDSAVRNG